MRKRARPWPVIGFLSYDGSGLTVIDLFIYDD
jgi:hypothetical protein